VRDEVSPTQGEVLGVPWVGSAALLSALGLVLGLILAFRAARRAGFERRLVVDLLAWIVIVSLFSSQLAALPQVMDGWSSEGRGAFVSGVARFGAALIGADAIFLGGVMGGCLALTLFAKRHGVCARTLLDAMSPGLFLGLVWGRFGCLLLGR